MPDECVQCVVTSPPYWGLRDYQVDPVVWGAEPGCAHEWATRAVEREMRKGTNLAASPSSDRGGAKKAALVNRQRYEHGTCVRCGAWRGHLGLEPSLNLYLEHLVQVFREVRRVLRPDGTVWLNLGDSYSQWANGNHGAGVKPKDLLGIPWRTALALQDDGWWLRMDIVWAKPNPMPESVEDRPTKSHEYIFLLAKGESYFYDQEAAKEPSLRADEHVWDNGKDGHGGGVSHAGQGSSTRKFAGDPTRRNKRSVWTVATRPFPEAHFATFPPELVTPCVQAGTSEGGSCGVCGAPFARTEKGGWERPCACEDSQAVPCVVLDPFLGSGTTGLVALRGGRDFVGIELNPDYARMAEKRIWQERTQAKLW